MIGFETVRNHDDDFVARVTDIAYQALLRQGLQRAFVDVELDLWKQIRAALQGPFAATRRLLEVA